MLGDLNGDGCDDFATTMTRSPNCGIQDKEVWTWSGRDGAEIGARWPANYWHPVRVLGDVDGDGLKDLCGKIVTCVPNCLSRIEAHSGRDWRLLWSVSGSWQNEWGNSFIGDVDVNGDGVPDMVVCAQIARAVYAYDGRTGRLLYVSAGIPGVTTMWGQSVARYMDRNMDGSEDYLIGGALGQTNAVFVVSGRTGTPILAGLGEPSVGLVSISVTACGDMNRDGIADFAGAGNGGVMVFSGADGSVIHRIRPYAGESALGSALVGGEDLDQDGIPDLVAGARFEGPPASPPTNRIYAFSGRDASVLWMLRPVDNYQNNMGDGPDTVSLLKPQPGNPFPLVVVEENGHGLGVCSCGTPIGLFRVMRSSPPGVDAYGSACTATTRTPRIGIRTDAAPGPRVMISNAPAGGIGLLLLGISRTQYAGAPLPIALDFLGLRGCLLQTSIEIALPVSLGTTGLDAGYGTVRLPVTLAPPGAGTRTVYAQWLTLDTSTSTFTGVSQPLALTTR